MIKNKIISFDNDLYGLTDKGNLILKDHKYYYGIIIINFFRRYCINRKKYSLKEIRKEQQKLRNYLLENRPSICVVCDKKLPLCLLETAHIKPRCLLNYSEKIDFNIVELMCRFCHNLYDNGFLGVNNGLLSVSPKISLYDLNYSTGKSIVCYNNDNKIYFDFHYTYI